MASISSFIAKSSPFVFTSKSSSSAFGCSFFISSGSNFFLKSAEADADALVEVAVLEEDCSVSVEMAVVLVDVVDADAVVDGLGDPGAL